MSSDIKLKKTFEAYRKRLKHSKNNNKPNFGYIHSMENKRFEIKGYNDHRKFSQFSYLFGIFIFALLAYTRYYDGNWDPISNIFVVLILLYAFRLFFPKVCFQKVFVAFGNNQITYQVKGFSFKQRKIPISDIEDIQTFESAIFLKRKDFETRISLIPFSDKLRADIVSAFESLQKEIKDE